MGQGRGYHILFGVTLLALLALGSWWTVFFMRSVEMEKLAAMEKLRHRAELAAVRLGGGEALPEAGPLTADLTLEVIRRLDRESGDMSVTTLPGHPDFAVRPSRMAVSRIEERNHRRRKMVTGEGVLLFSLLAICTVMLYRQVRQQRLQMKRMESFIAAVSHEMKTPLTGIKSMLQTFVEGRVPGDQRDRLYAMGLKEAERLEHTIENVLLTGRLRAEQLETQVELVTLRTVLERFVVHRQRTLADRPDSLQLVWEAEGELHVEADSSALRLILDNLTDNAYKYGGPEPVVTIRARRDSGLALVSVEDCGIGFAREHAEQLFTPFQRTSAAVNAVQHGTGLGLSIARALAVRMGGQLSAESDGPGQGSRFTLRLKEAKVQ
jgi:signal transduction histidine kinase